MLLNRFLLLSFICLGLMFSCTKNSIDFELEQDACKRFRINAPQYTITADPCDDSVRFKAEVSFAFDQSEECLHLIENSPVFYKADNQKINPSSFTEIIPKERFTIQADRVNYVFEANFSTLAAAKELNHIVLDFNTENELGIESNELQIRMNTSCSKVDRSNYTINPNATTIPRAQSLFTIRLWDNAAEDGDIVSVYLNGQWIIENHTLTNAGTNFTFSTSLLNPGANDLVVFALNEGSSGPNTVSIAVNGTEVPNFKPGLLTGEAVRINF